jgi:hypothetical protein
VPALADSVVRIRETGAGIELHYPYFRHPGVAIGTLVTGGGFAGFAWLFQAVAAGDRASPPIVMIWVFAAIGALIFLWGLYLLGNSLHVTAGRQGLDIVRGVFGLRFARHAAATDIARIDKAIGMQFQRGNRTHAYYRIRVHTLDGRRLTAGTGLTGASRVERIIERLRTALGLPDPGEAPAPAGSSADAGYGAVPEVEMLAARLQSKRGRLLIQVAVAMIFLAIVVWNFRSVLFR